MKKILKSSFIAGLAGAILTVGLSAGQSLKIGDPAPPLKVFKWLKGEPVPRFEPGKVYVVEFWATWCGPCLVSMPHLTELQKKYEGKATIISVNSIEAKSAEDPDALIGKVEAFVARKGDKMGYTVAMDDPKTNPIFTAWMTAAGMEGIPASFVIDQKGFLVWIGHPQVGLDEAIAQTLEGTVDIAAGRAEQEKNAAVNAADEILSAALKEKRYKDVIAEADKMMAGNPNLSVAESMPSVFRFLAMLHVDEARALDEARKMIEAKDANKILRPFIPKLIVGEEGLSKKAYAFAVDNLKIALETEPNQVGHLASLARGYHLIGDNAKAVEIQERAIKAALADESLAQIIDDLLPDLQKELAAYKEAIK